MANLTTAGVTVNRFWSEGGLNGKQRVARDVTLVLVAQGDGANGSDIPVSALDLATVEEVTPLVKSDDSIIVVASPDTLKNSILLKAAGTNAPAQYTGTFNCIVYGQPVYA